MNLKPVNNSMCFYLSKNLRCDSLFHGGTSFFETIIQFLWRNDTYRVSYDGRDDVLAHHLPCCNSFSCQSPNGRHPARISQTFCTFIVTLWVELEEQAHSLWPEVPSERLYLPTSIRVALLLSRERHQLKALVCLLGHSHSKKLETRNDVKPNLPLQD